jgi:16S rRNA (uracil1498-N3)-methyltransferase
MRQQGTGRILVLVGPEGGWSDAERKAAREAGCGTWTFAEHVLRVETAALAATALLAEARCSVDGSRNDKTGDSDS